MATTKKKIPVLITTERRGVFFGYGPNSKCRIGAKVDGVSTFQLVDYSKPPPGYTVEADSIGIWGWTGGGHHHCDAFGLKHEDTAIADAWKHHRRHNDPPGLAVNAWGFGQRLTETPWWKPLWCRAALAAARAAAWTWYDQRLALAVRVDSLECEVCGNREPQTGYDAQPDAQPWCIECDREMVGFDDMWPDCLAWSDDQVAEVERWLVDSNAETPEGSGSGYGYGYGSGSGSGVPC